LDFHEVQKRVGEVGQGHMPIDPYDHQ
jgi:hypothetical protein